jgi:predicted RNase H-like HicB family nuclease
MNNMKTIQINSAVWKEGDYFVAQCLNVEVSSFGDTKDEALTNLQEALGLYFEDNAHPEITVIEKPEIVDFTLTYA